MSRIQTIVSMLLLPSESNSAILLPDKSLISFSNTFLLGLFAFSVIFSFFIMFSFVFMYTIIQCVIKMSRDLRKKINFCIPIDIYPALWYNRLGNQSKFAAAGAERLLIIVILLLWRLRLQK